VFTYYGMPDNLVTLIEADAVRAGNRARMLMALEDDDTTSRSVRRRLATTLVQLGVSLDPRAADDLPEEVA
jgi:hypothetical protein